MQFFNLSLLVAASWTASVSATGVLLPLYIHPNDGAANWKPVLDAASSWPSLSFLTVINPFHGPGRTGQAGDADKNYITGVSKLNGLQNVKTMGYVRTNYTMAPMQELKANMSTWKKWSSYQAADISVHGIFLDESSSSNLSYMAEAAAYARELFGQSATTVVCNFREAVPEAYYGVCDVVIAFESCLNCARGPQYKSSQTVRANIPAGREAGGAVIVNTFSGRAYDGSVADEKLLWRYARDLREEGVGWAYFCSSGYDDVQRRPATIGEVARDLGCEAD